MVAKRRPGFSRSRVFKEGEENGFLSRGESRGGLDPPGEERPGAGRD